MCDTAAVIYQLSYQATESWALCEFVYTRRWWRMQVIIGELYEDMIDHRSYTHNLKAVKKITPSINSPFHG